MTPSTVTIDRVALRIRLPAAMQQGRAAFERIGEDVLAAAIEVALARLGLRNEGVTCIRAVELELAIGARQADATWVSRWIDALSEAVHAALVAGDPHRVARYPSQLAALVDVGQSLVRGDLRRRWAWVMLGIGSMRELASVDLAHAAFVRALLARPELIVATFGRLARGPVADHVARRLTPHTWIALVTAALERHGLPRELSAAMPPELQAGSPTGSSTGLRAGSTAPLLVEALADSPWRSLAPREDGPTVLVGHWTPRRAWAVLALLDGAPMLARQVVCQADAAVELDQLAAHALDRGSESTPFHRTVRSTGVRSGPSRAHVTAEPTEPTEHASTDAPRSAEVPEDDTVDVARTHDLPTARNTLAPWQDDATESRAHGTSAWAGLLLLLAVFRREGLWVAFAALADRLQLEVRSLLHAFGRLLVPAPIADDDPALLAFIGRPPNAPLVRRSPEVATVATPWEMPTVLDEASLDRIREPLLALRGRLLAALEARFAAQPGRSADADALLVWLLRRRGDIRGERGWLDIHFDVRDVDTGIRRAGLDLDPDWVPELGVVVRFHYG